MAQILEVLHLPDQNRVPEMEIRCGWIEAHLHDEGLTGLLGTLQLCPQLAQPDDVDTTPGEYAACSSMVIITIMKGTAHGRGILRAR